MGQPPPPACADDACDTGKCTSWVDEALDAAGEEYADAPRPGSCCEKDAKAQKDAARIKRILRAHDPVARLEAVRAAGGVMERANLDEDEEDEDEEDEDSDDLLTDDDDDDDDLRMASTMDPVLREIHERRLAEMKAAAAKNAATRQREGASSYNAAKEADIPTIVKSGPSRVVFHFVLEGMDECARIDEVLDALAPAHPKTRFVRVDALCPSPMLRTIGAPTLPAVITFRRKKLGAWTCGLNDFGGVEGFDEEKVIRWLARVAGALPGHPLAPPPPSKGGVAGGANGDSSDEGEKPSKGRGADGDGSDDDDEVVPCEAGEGAWSGVGGTPCETCGRRYPHQHFRALRHGGERERRGSDDEEEESD